MSEYTLDLKTDFKDRTELLEQLAYAQYVWHKSEEKNLGTFHKRMEICNYVEWLAVKAIEGTDEPFKLVPTLRLTPQPHD